MEPFIVLLFFTVFILIFRNWRSPGLPGSWLHSQLRDLQKLADEFPPAGTPAQRPPMMADAACSSCGAPVQNPADVSPHGDVKCTHCGRWFSVQKR